MNAVPIAAEPTVSYLAPGAIDLQKDLRAASGEQLDYVRSHLVVAARAAGIAPPIDSVYPHINDRDGLRREAAASRALGLFGKSAIHPAQLPIIHAAFDPDADEVTWAQQVLAAFDEAGGAAAQLPMENSSIFPLRSGHATSLNRPRPAPHHGPIGGPRRNVSAEHMTDRPNRSWPWLRNRPATTPESARHNGQIDHAQVPTRNVGDILNSGHRAGKM